MNIIPWNVDLDVSAGTTLRDKNKKENNNLALHTKTNEAAVIENRQIFCDSLNIKLNNCVFAQQTHSDHIYEVKSIDKGKGAFIQTTGIADCDALYTREKEILIGVFHADCVPILLYDPFSQLIAAIHSGWQGTVKEITRKTVEYLIKIEHVNPCHLHAYIGPAISYQSFEVGKDVVELVKAMSFDTSNFIKMKDKEKALIDNKGLNQQMLLRLGIPKDLITINQSDTYIPNDALFSYRRDHDCGRHLSYIMMRK